MRLLSIVFCGLACTNAALADCVAPEEPFMSCAFSNGKSVELCTDGNFARYTFGRPGQDPELAVRLAFGEGAEMIPWNGVGRSIWEAIRVQNNDVIYEVYAGIDKMLAVEDDPNDEIYPTFGGILVEDLDGNELAHLQCIPASVEYRY